MRDTNSTPFSRTLDFWFAPALSGRIPHKQMSGEMRDTNSTPFSRTLDFPPRSWPLRAAALPVNAALIDSPYPHSRPRQGRFLALYNYLKISAPQRAEIMFEMF